MRPVHRVFVTGATGFVGRAVIQALRGEGYVVRCLVRRGSEPSLRGVGAIERVEGDVLAPQLLDEGMAGCGAVVHLVGIIREHIATNTTFYRVHVQGTVNVVAAAAAAGVRRYVHMSALGAREGAPSRYHRTKWAAEEVVRACGLPWTIFRPSVIYGRGDGFVSPLARLVRRFPVAPPLRGARPPPHARRGQRRLRPGAVPRCVRAGTAAPRDGPAPAARVTAHPPLNTSPRRNAREPRDLGTRIEAELRERIEEAVDFACLDALVAWRRAHGLPAPVAESARDREEFARSVRAFLERLRDAIAVGLTSEQRAKLDAAAHAGGDPTERLLTVQVALAKELPDYWLRFEASRASYVGGEPVSGGERRSLLRRLLGRG